MMTFEQPRPLALARTYRKDQSRHYLRDRCALRNTRRTDERVEVRAARGWQIAAWNRGGTWLRRLGRERGQDGNQRTSPPLEAGCALQAVSSWPRLDKRGRTHCGGRTDSVRLALTSWSRNGSRGWDEQRASPPEASGRKGGRLLRCAMSVAVRSFELSTV